jgi:hypothetical protein
MKGITSSITDTIEEYRSSKHKLMGRIQEINGKIASQGRKKQAGGELKELHERRRRLYAMSYDLDFALRLMGEYTLAAHIDERTELSYAG